MDQDNVKVDNRRFGVRMAGMKWKLNLNEPGTKMLRWIGLFLIAIPVFLWGIASLLGSTHPWHGAIWRLLWISVLMGTAFLTVLFVLLIIEFVQDSHLDRAYHKKQGQRIRLENGLFECQYCGCQKVKENDRRCPACNKELL